MLLMMYHMQARMFIICDHRFLFFILNSVLQHDIFFVMYHMEDDYHVIIDYYFLILESALHLQHHIQDDI